MSETTNEPAKKDSAVVWHETNLERAARWKSLNQKGGCIWFTGLSGSGKSSVAMAVEELLVKEGRVSYVLDGDNLRHGLNSDLGFSPADRDENVRRVAQVARLMADSGCVALVPLISPYKNARQLARDLHNAAQIPFMEVFIDTPIDICMKRDPKGMYAKAKAGEIKGFTGVDDPYETPENPELILRPEDGDEKTQAKIVIESFQQLTS